MNLTKNKKKKVLDYSVPDKVYRRVMYHLDMYDIYKETSKKEFSYDEMAFLPSSFPDSDGIFSKTNQIARPTQHLVDDIIAEKAKIVDARKAIEHIEAGIARSAQMTRSPADVKELQEDLKRNLIYKVPNESKNKTCIGRNKPLLKKARQRAVYFISVEFGYIEISPEIDREEQLKSWGRGRI